MRHSSSSGLDFLEHLQEKGLELGLVDKLARVGVGDLEELFALLGAGQAIGHTGRQRLESLSDLIIHLLFGDLSVVVDVDHGEEFVNVVVDSFSEAIDVLLAHLCHLYFYSQKIYTL